MDDQTFKDLIKDQLGSILKKINDPDEGLSAIKRTVDANNLSILKIEETIGGYADSYKENQRNIERLDIRLNVVEDEMAINVPEELKVPHFSTK